MFECLVDFWVARSSFYEQPNVNHLNSVIVAIQTTQGVFYSSVDPRVSELLASDDHILPGSFEV